MLRRYTVHVGLVVSFIIFHYVTSLESYSRYVVNVTKFEVCSEGAHGGSGSGLPAVSVNVSWSKMARGDHIRIRADFHKPVGPVASRTKMSKQMEGGFQQVMDLRVKNICQHYTWTVLRPLLPKVDSRCYIAKGVVELVMQDYNQLVHSYMGEKFFLGAYRVVTRVFTPSDHVACIAVENVFTSA